MSVLSEANAEASSVEEVERMLSERPAGRFDPVPVLLALVFGLEPELEPVVVLGIGSFAVVTSI